MSSFKESLLNQLRELKGSAKFVTEHTSDFLFPGLEIEEVGELSFPVHTHQAKALIQVAHKAPFGKGTETIVDSSVRSCWEINSDKLTFNNDQWSKFMEKVLRKIKPELGLEDFTISAHLYKMLIYETGSFFLKHKDSEKEKGMFGTLVIGLPSRHTGGELVVSFEGEEQTISFEEGSGNYKIDYTAFYADCDHEVKPVTSGYRVCLVYNLVQEKAGSEIQPTSMASHVDQLARILETEEVQEKPVILLLGHQYTPQNFSADSLKLNDRPKAKALMQAAVKAGCYAKLCLVTSYRMGPVAYNGGYDDDDEDAEMEEVFDESLTIEHWAESETPCLINVSFEEEDLIRPFTLNEGDPIEKEATGFMGNYGPDLMHWYHYGAVMIWSRQENARMLELQDAATQLQWIHYFVKNQVSEREAEAVNSAVSTGLNYTISSNTTRYNPLIEWVIYRNDKDLLLLLDTVILKHYFRQIDTGYWMKFFAFSDADTNRKLLNRITGAIDLPTLQHLLAVLRGLYESGNFKTLVGAEIAALPNSFLKLPLNHSKRQYAATIPILQNLFWFQEALPQGESWEEQMSGLLTKEVNSEYIKQIMVPALLERDTQTNFSFTLLEFAKNYLQHRVDNRPQPPADWSRPVPEAPYYKLQWDILRPFLESGEEVVFEYRKNQSDRTEMERAIAGTVVDLKTETIKRGSPHTLRITKTLAAYERALEEWKDDGKLLSRISY